MSASTGSGPPPDRPVVVWFREDLRLADNPALTAAVETGAPLICLFLLDEVSPGVRPRGGASRWWLHGSLSALEAKLGERGVPLLLRRGPAAEHVASVVRASGARAVFWNRRFGSAEQGVDASVARQLQADRVTVQTFNGKLLHDPSEIRTRAGEPFRVFTPFWRTAQATPPLPPLPAPAHIRAAAPMEGDALSGWNLLPRHPDWAGGLRETWRPGEDAAAERLQHFIVHGLAGYSGGRDFPDLETTSRLSPYLAFGEISPRQIWAALEEPDARQAGDSLAKLRNEIGWREFAWHLLSHSPDLANRNMNAAFDRFAWTEPGRELEAWRKGRTGYPIVDAAMRQLWQTGWMHNRLRLVAASFMVKHLLIDWRHGERWFWDTLVDADPANNAVGWQWVAGSGADPAPFFRIFNPVLQGEKFDPEGAFVRRFIPELAGLSASHIHAPWRAPASALQAAGVRLGADYPLPVVEHGFARSRALAAFEAMRSS